MPLTPDSCALFSITRENFCLLRLEENADNFSIDFRKDWQRRVRVHFDQVRLRNAFEMTLYAERFYILSESGEIVLENFDGLTYYLRL